MYDNYNYPLGADNANAPWNDASQPRQFDVSVTCTLQRYMTITTEDYANCEGDIDTSDTDWVEAYHYNHYTILQMLEELKGYIENELKSSPNIQRRRLARLKSMLADLQDWNIESEDIEEV